MARSGAFDSIPGLIGDARSPPQGKFKFGVLLADLTPLALLGDDGVIDAESGEAPPGGRVVPAVEPDGLDVGEQPALLGSLEGRLEQEGVVPVGPVDGPADRDAGPIGEDGPLPAELGSVGRVLARSIASCWAFVQRPVDRHVVEVEADDLVVGRHGFGDDRFEDTGGNPLVPTGPYGRVGHLHPTQPLGVHSGAAGDQPREHHLEAVPVGRPRPVTTERMGPRGLRDEGLSSG